MGSSNLKSIGTLIKRNLISVIFPTIVIFSIYVDLKHTTRWKHQLVEEKAQ